jgi:hypothetical protein
MFPKGIYVENISNAKVKQFTQQTTFKFVGIQKSNHRSMENYKVFQMMYVSFLLLKVDSATSVIFANSGFS